MKNDGQNSIYQGCLNEILVNIKVVQMTAKKFPETQLGKITTHPRFVRYLGSCVNNAIHEEIFIVSDFFVGASLDVRMNQKVFF